MFYNLKIILRNLRRGGIYSAINIAGLTIGMAAAILILAWIYNQWSYDRFHSKAKQIYVVYNRGTFDGSLLCWHWTPVPMGPTLKSDYPEISGTARIMDDELLFSNDDRKFKFQTVYTDPDFLNMFDFPLLQGNKEIALNDPYSLILTEKTALLLFDKENPMGKKVLIDGQYSMTVTGVMKDLPDNTMFNFNALVSSSFLGVRGWSSESWTANNVNTTFVELQPNSKLDLINESIRNITNAHTDNQAQIEVFLYPLTKQHLYSKFENGIPVGGMIESLRLYGLIAGLVLLIACINFMNLSTARGAKRAKEVGIRKVLGGKRILLIRLFMTESLIVTFIAGAMALILALVVLPVFSTLMGQQISLNLSNGWFWVAGLGFVLFAGLLAGSYPAFYLSSFLPIKALKGTKRKKQRLISSRKVLVVLQFTVACVLIFSTLVIHRQIKYAQNRESGYNKDQLVYVMLEGDINKNYKIIKQELLDSRTAISVTKTKTPMTMSPGNTWGVEWKGKDPATRLSFDLFFTDADWTKTVGTTIIEGRDIDINTYATDSTAMLLNESAVKIMNFKHPIGEIVSTQGKDWHVVGIVKDFIIHAPYDPINPVLIGGPSGWLYTMHFKLNSQNRIKDNLAQAEQIFKKYNPNYPLDYHFVDEEYALKFKEVQQLESLTNWFAGLTIFISCMGLFALVAYMAETRRKEIGIRKVLGASVANVILLLSKEFLILVFVSFVTASPIAWLIMNKWLSGYSYRTEIPWWMFVAVGCLSLCIALITVGFQAIRAATANPVKAIKTE